MEKLLAFNSSSAHLFSPIQPLLEAVQQGLKQTISAWQLSTNSFDVALPALTWAIHINKEWYDKTTARAKTLIAKVESGQYLIANEFHELGWYLVDNLESKLYDRVRGAFLKTLKVEVEGVDKLFSALGTGLSWKGNRFLYNFYKVFLLQDGYQNWLVLIPDIASKGLSAGLSEADLKLLLVDGPKHGVTPLFVGSYQDLVNNSYDTYVKFTLQLVDQVFLGIRISDQNHTRYPYLNHEPSLKPHQGYILYPDGYEFVQLMEV